METSNNYYESGVAKYNTEDLHGALEDFEDATRLDPWHSNAYCYIAMINKKLRNSCAAQSFFKIAIEVDPNNAFAYTGFGNFYFEKADYTNSARCFRKAIKVSPNNLDLFDELANTLLALGDRKGAINCYNGAIAKDSRNVKWYMHRSHVFGLIKEYKKAEEDLNTVLWIKPEHEPAFYARGKIKLYSSNFLASIEDFDIAIKLCPSDSINYFFKANAEFLLGYYDKALCNYSKALSLRKDVDCYYFNRGLTYLKLNRLRDAFREFQIAIMTIPFSNDLHLIRGLKYYKERKLIKAVNEWNRLELVS